MALLLRNFHRITSKSLRSTYSTVSSPKNNSQTQPAAEEPHIDDDMPISLENPFTRARKLCILCKLNIIPDYKNVRLLSQFQSTFTGRIYGRHITGLCKGKQEKVEKEILKAQNCGLMPTYHKVLEYHGDPKLFDPDHPFRPHKY